MRPLLTLLVLFHFVFYPLAAKAEFGGHFGAHFGYGKMGSTDPSPFSYQSRAIGSFNAELMPGWRLLDHALLLGLLFDLRFLAQLANGTTDFSGHGYTLGLGSTFNFGPVKFLFSYDPWARHSFSDSSGSTLKGSGVHLSVGGKVFSNTSADLEYYTSKFNSVDQGGTDINLEQYPVKLWAIGFGLSYNF
jgi:hypothetical protein